MYEKQWKKKYIGILKILTKYRFRKTIFIKRNILNGNILTSLNPHFILVNHKCNKTVKTIQQN